mmetsp:Transcript_57445/g.158988  ORF Transcript_57445/g.158988 Transcript_57445/m.158988 type:complete len:264 (-) Transcript_57445:173-964(-)
MRRRRRRFRRCGHLSCCGRSWLLSSGLLARLCVLFHAVLCLCQLRNVARALWPRSRGRAAGAGTNGWAAGVVATRNGVRIPSGHSRSRLCAQQIDLCGIGNQTQEDEVCIVAAETMRPLRVVPDHLHDLVLALPRIAVVGDDHSHAPQRFRGGIRLRPEAEPAAEAHHELGARGDRVPVELLHEALDSALPMLRILRSTEAPGALLVHLRTGRHTVQRDEQQDPWLYDGDQQGQLRLDEAEEHLLRILRRPLVNATVYDAIEV